ncbi:asparagine synthase (glutamine-hydrolyzing) [Robertmurraya yapensis]|uniref:asparagine synthase (glutamine-hydrolyzing) n=1 Tax=Bacillus yapensis TaxID=2492960 RepID=A0A3S0KX16_9BACI|nr:asparagine synthase (glutamine-hydrolyzing) [Bacillus yapensis]RTR36270.1 asparagine synthase (glutamine-hydrolyzing) [Bacillus yapensis]TKT05773.1 asparagine synthase (glutamine-hydrolyzing) [Bacillus yapensis]
MCGFVGVLRNNNVEETDHRKWNNALFSIHHRGPDATGEYKDKRVELGFKRLSIIDLEQGHQPLTYEGRYHIIFNGEIYNYVELRESLIKLGYSFQTMSDTEVIVAMYAHIGPECVHELRGMFAFVIWDSKEEVLFAARDPFGIKPFYYYETEERFIFSSEQKSIRCLTDDHELSTASLQHYLTYQYVPEPSSLSKSILKLSPGHFVLKESNMKTVTKCFHNKMFFPKNDDFSNIVRKTRKVLEDSVEKHMRSDVPVGAFLSSGIDSTTMVALARKHNPWLKTFTAGFEVEGYSEVEIAKETAEKLEVENVHKLITAEEVIKELRNIIWHMDDPVADPAAIPLYFIAKEASKHVKVVLSGEGADELFGGYNIYREPLSLQGITRLPNWLKTGLRKGAGIVPDGVKGKSYLYRGTTPLEDRYIGNAFIFSESEKQKMLLEYMANQPYTEITRDYYRDATLYGQSSKMQYIDIHTWLPGDILVKADRMSMAHSLELRVPFLDKEVFEVAREIPDQMKIANGTTKFVLREAVKDLVPNFIVDRKKLGFPVPIRLWLKNELYDWAKDAINNSSTIGTIFNKSELISLLEEHAIGKKDNSRKLWTVLTFMIWYSIYEEKEFEKISDTNVQDGLVIQQEYAFVD